MKTEILQRFAAALELEDFKELQNQVKEVRKEFREAAEQLEGERKKAFLEEGGESQFYIPTKDEDDEKYGELIGQFKEREQTYREEQEKIRLEKTAQKKELLTELTSLVSAGTNLGSAFGSYNTIHDKWKAIGFVDGPEGKELQNSFNYQVDRFFYSVNITREMRDLDFNKNLEVKRGLIAELDNIAAVESIQSREKQLRAIQSKYNSTGPVPLELKDEINGGFRKQAQEIYDSIQAHYDARRAEYQGKLKEKIALCEKINELNTRHPQKVTGWNKMTDEIIATQKEWNGIGYSEENETIWRVFRNSCDAFFAAKRGYFDKLNEERDRNSELKQDLLQKAESVKDDVNWKQTATYLMDLQKSWKEIGPGRRQDEQRLWNSFRGACNHFFDARKSHFAEQDVEHAENLKLKEALIDKIGQTALSGNQQTDFQLLKSFADEWSKIGFVPIKQKDTIYKKYHEALDTKYDQLKIDREQRMAIQFENRIESLKNSDGADHLIKKEKTNIRNKIQYIENDIQTYENNMGFFANSNKPNPLLKDIEKKIKKLRAEAAELRSKLKMLPKT